MKIALMGLPSAFSTALAELLQTAFETKSFIFGVSREGQTSAMSEWLEQSSPDCIVHITDKLAMECSRLPADELFYLNTDLPVFLAAQAGLRAIPLLQVNFRNGLDSVSGASDAAISPKKIFDRLWDESLSEAQRLISQTTHRHFVLDLHANLPEGLNAVTAPFARMQARKVLSFVQDKFERKPLVPSAYGSYQSSDSAVSALATEHALFIRHPAHHQVSRHLQTVSYT